MIQKTIRDWGSVEFTTTEGAEQQTEWNDRTVYAVDGYNSIAELGANQAPMKVKTDFITVTQAVNLDTIESDTATNKTNADASKVITDFITITQAVNLDTVESDTATNNAKVTYDDAAQVATNKTNADASKIKTDLLTVTGAIDLDSNVPLLDAANTFASANNAFIGGLAVRDSGDSADLLDIVPSGTLLLIENPVGEIKIKGNSNGTNPLFSVWDGITKVLDSDTIAGTWAADNCDVAGIISVGDKALVTREYSVGSYTNGEPTGSDKVVNMVSLTQAEYNAGTPVATTYYVITDA